MQETTSGGKVLELASKREAKAPRSKASPTAPVTFAERILLEAGPKTEAELHEWKYESAVAEALAKSLGKARAELVSFKPSPELKHNLEQVSAVWGLPLGTVVDLLLSRLLTDGLQVSLVEESNDYPNKNA